MLKFCKFMYNNKGNAAIEFAIVLPFLLLLLSGVINFGMILAKKNELTTVVSVGMLYAFGNSSVPANVNSAMVNATNIAPLTVTVTQFCQCIDNSQPGCGNNCGDGKPAPKYVMVTANSEVDLIALNFVLQNPYPLTVTGTMRVP